MSGADARPNANVLPEYRVRVNGRARRVRLTVSARDGLVVTLPPGVPERHAAEAVAARASWARSALEGVAERRAELLAGPDALLPSFVELTAFGEAWPVEYREASLRTVLAREREGLLLVSGRIDDAEACLLGLRRWRTRVARARLVPEFERVAREVGVELPRAISVRGQRSRWGSCSSGGTISLNRNLVFLPAALMRHVLLHELAHMTHHNHSARFHDLLAGYDPKAREHRSLLKNAWRHVPAWAEG